MSQTDRYELLQELGRNQYATVWEAHDDDMDRPVAVMELREEFRADPAQWNDIWQEIRRRFAVVHRYIVPVYEVDRERGWIIVELMKGDLKERISQRPLTPDSVRTVLRRTLRGLAQMHSQGLVHGDIKPANLLYDQNGGVKVSFSPGLEIGGRIPHKDRDFKYLAPEIIEPSFGEIGPAVDLYCLGFSSLELLKGPGFDSLVKGTVDTPDPGTAWLRWHRSATETFTPVSKILPKLPADLEKVLNRLLQKQVSERYATAEEALADLDAEDRRPDLPVDVGQAAPAKSAAGPVSRKAIAPLAVKGDTSQSRAKKKPPPQPPHTVESAAGKRKGRKQAFVLVLLMLVAAGLLYVKYLKDRESGNEVVASVPDDPSPPGDAPLPAAASVALRTDPPDAQVVIRQGGNEVMTRTLPGEGEVRLPPGAYELVFSSKGFESRTIPFDIDDNLAFQELGVIKLDADGTMAETPSVIDVPPAPMISVVPDLAGMTIEEALAALEEEGLVGQYDDERLLLTDRVTVQDPAAGTELDDNDAVVLGGRIVVPDVTEMTIEDAISLLEDKGLAPQFDAEQLLLNDRVTAQDPAAGTQLNPRDTIMLDGRVVVPELTEMTIEQAVAALEDEGLIAQYDAERLLPSDLVTAHEPVAGAVLYQRDIIELDARVVVPGEEGDTMSDRIARISDAPGRLESMVEGDHLESDPVYSQDPAPGARAFPRTEIEVVPGVEVPDLLGLSRDEALQLLNDLEIPLGQELPIETFVADPNLVGSQIRRQSITAGLYARRDVEAIDLDVETRIAFPKLLAAPFDAQTARDAQQAWARCLYTDVVVENSIGMKLTLIPPGEFKMGSDQDERDEVVALWPDSDADSFLDEQQHPVRITQPYAVAVHEVTVGQFGMFVDEENFVTEAELDGEGGWGWDDATQAFAGRDLVYTWRNTGWSPYEDDHPVVNVAWNDAVAFCNWLSRREEFDEYYQIEQSGDVSIRGGNGYRLLTEAEWEYACRSGTDTIWHSGNASSDVADVGNVADLAARQAWTNYPGYVYLTADDGSVFTAAVGQYEPNQFGLFDMHGNVWEWCWDAYAEEAYSLPDEIVDDPVVSEDSGRRILRGGSWSLNPRVARAANRNSGAVNSRDRSTGFRIGRSHLSAPIVN